VLRRYFGDGRADGEHSYVVLVPTFAARAADGSGDDLALEDHQASETPGTASSSSSTASGQRPSRELALIAVSDE